MITTCHTSARRRGSDQLSVRPLRGALRAPAIRGSMAEEDMIRLLPFLGPPARRDWNALTSVK